MLLCTRDCGLAFLVTLVTAGVVAGLSFFMVVVMSWAIGPIEVIALIIFIGYAVTYSLHVAHGYGAAASAERAEGDLAAEATEVGIDKAVLYCSSALSTMGPAALGSAATTLGCAAFLVFRTLTIFQRLGAVVMAVTFMSIVSALAPLPAMLLWFGPRKPGRLFFGLEFMWSCCVTAWIWLLRKGKLGASGKQEFSSVCPNAAAGSQATMVAPLPPSSWVSTPGGMPAATPSRSSSAARRADLAIAEAIAEANDNNNNNSSRPRRPAGQSQRRSRSSPGAAAAASRPSELGTIPHGGAEAKQQHQQQLQELQQQQRLAKLTQRGALFSASGRPASIRKEAPLPLSPGRPAAAPTSGYFL
ncbi:unnamed protein product [Polarella glacialis]|uniref:SSD domain-containing protein n=1 Tax=Polarella glacialis TaxID=89957 RepID=A0A813GER5_POLGL|nr:unnamed protein product [Polarella glacialis]